MNAADRVLKVWSTPRPALVVAVVALVVAGLAAVVQPAPYAAVGLVALIALALVVPVLAPPRRAVAVLGGAGVVLLVRLLSGGLTGGRAWGLALATVLAVLAVGWAAALEPSRPGRPASAPPRGRPGPTSRPPRRPPGTSSRRRPSRNEAA